MSIVSVHAVLAGEPEEGPVAGVEECSGGGMAALMAVVVVLVEVPMDYS